MKRKIEIGTIVRTVVLVVALINQMLTMSGHSPLPFSEEEVSEGVSMAITAAASLWAWWKNNSYTQAAIAADEYMRVQKSK